MGGASFILESTSVRFGDLAAVDSTDLRITGASESPSSGRAARERQRSSAS